MKSTITFICRVAQYFGVDMSTILHQHNGGTQGMNAGSPLIKVYKFGWIYLTCEMNATRSRFPKTHAWLNIVGLCMLHDHIALY